MEFVYKTKDVCAAEIRFDIDHDVVTNIRFLGGCNGNLKAIATLLEGCRTQEIIEKLSGNTCGRRPTSCADQLARAVQKACDKQKGV